MSKYPHLDFKPTVLKKDLKDGENLCEYCIAKCCHYIALPIDTPETWEEFEFIRWYMLHEGISIFVDDDTWFLCVHSTCRELRSDYMCGIYETRPIICREYSTKNCEYEGDGVYDMLFETPDQIYEYAEAYLGPLNSSDIRSPKPKLLPVLN